MQRNGGDQAGDRAAARNPAGGRRPDWPGRRHHLTKNFNEQHGLDRHRADPHGRRRAAAARRLSMRARSPASRSSSLGVGEKMDAIEDFHPARLADRILGMGDIVSPGRKARPQNIDMARSGQKMAEKMRQGKSSISTTSRSNCSLRSRSIGGMGGIMGMLPGVAKMKSQISSIPPMGRRQVSSSASAPSSRP